MTDSIFSKIIKGEIFSYKIYEDNSFYVFLDAFPIAKGHTLIIPKKQVDYFFDLEDNLISDIQIVAKKIAKSIQKSISCVRVGQAILGLEIPHAHIHLIPINGPLDIDFSKKKLKLSKENFLEIQQLIISNL